jgi:hypothetical protein
MNKTGICGIFAAASLALAAFTLNTSASAKSADAGLPFPYAKVKTDGTFAMGRKFTVQAVVQTISKEEAVDKITAYLLTDGDTISAANKEMGYVSAQQPVAGSDGHKTVTVNFSIRDRDEKTKLVTITIAMPGGCAIGKEGIVRGFADTLDQLGKPWEVQ